MFEALLNNGVTNRMHAQGYAWWYIHGKWCVHLLQLCSEGPGKWECAWSLIMSPSVEQDMDWALPLGAGFDAVLHILSLKNEYFDITWCGMKIHVELTWTSVLNAWKKLLLLRNFTGNPKELNILALSSLLWNSATEKLD